MVLVTLRDKVWNNGGKLTTHRSITHSIISRVYWTDEPGSGHRWVMTWRKELLLTEIITQCCAQDKTSRRWGQMDKAHGGRGDKWSFGQALTPVHPVLVQRGRSIITGSGPCDHWGEAKGDILQYGKTQPLTTYWLYLAKKTTMDV